MRKKFNRYTTVEKVLIGLGLPIVLPFVLVATIIWLLGESFELAGGLLGLDE